MNRVEFEQLRALPGKILREDLVLRLDPRNGKTLRAKDVRVENEIGWGISVDFHYDPRFPKFVINFSADGVGPICRLCVNGTQHKDTGRYHKHELKMLRDPALNLPFALRVDNLHDKTPSEVWKWLCREANIDHQGVFHDPL